MMKIFCISLIFILSFAYTANATISFLQSNVAESGTTIVLNNVKGNTLIAICLKWEGPTSGNATVSDGISSFSNTNVVVHANNDLHSEFAYLLNSNAGNRTYTVTFPASASFQRIRIGEFNHTYGDFQFDTSSGSSGTGSTTSSGNYTTTGTDEITFGCYGEYSPSVTPFNYKINATTADGIILGNLSQMWYLATTTTFTSSSTVSIGISSDWVNYGAAIKNIYKIPYRAIFNGKHIFNGQWIFQ